MIETGGWWQWRRQFHVHAGDGNDTTGRNAGIQERNGSASGAVAVFKSVLTWNDMIRANYQSLRYQPGWGCYQFIDRVGGKVG